MLFGGKGTKSIVKVVSYIEAGSALERANGLNAGQIITRGTMPRRHLAVAFISTKASSSFLRFFCPRTGRFIVVAM